MGDRQVYKVQRTNSYVLIPEVTIGMSFDIQLLHTVHLT